jgi:hypothetical protein
LERRFQIRCGRILCERGSSFLPLPHTTPRTILPSSRTLWLELSTGASTHLYRSGPRSQDQLRLVLIVVRSGPKSQDPLRNPAAVTMGLGPCTSTWISREAVILKLITPSKSAFSLQPRRLVRGFSLRRLLGAPHAMLGEWGRNVGAQR